MKKIFNLALMALLISPVMSVRGAESGVTGNGYLARANIGRVQAVTSLIDGAKEGGVTIKHTPVSYCRKLDQFYDKHPDLKSRELAIVLKTLIVMEYDWSQKGVDKDQLARQYLGEKLYQENRARLKKS